MIRKAEQTHEKIKEVYKLLNEITEAIDIDMIAWCEDILEEDNEDSAYFAANRIINLSDDLHNYSRDLQMIRG